MISMAGGVKHVFVRTDGVNKVFTSSVSVQDVERSFCTKYHVNDLKNGACRYPSSISSPGCRAATVIDCLHGGYTAPA